MELAEGWNRGQDQTPLLLASWRCWKYDRDLSPQGRSRHVPSLPLPSIFLDDRTLKACLESLEFRGKRGAGFRCEQIAPNVSSSGDPRYPKIWGPAQSGTCPGTHTAPQYPEPWLCGPTDRNCRGRGKTALS